MTINDYEAARQQRISEAAVRVIISQGANPRKGDGKAPDWAIQVLDAICDHVNRPDRPIVAWRQGKRLHTSGTTYSMLDPDNRHHMVPYRIVVTAGTCKMDALCVFVHEICHWLSGEHYESHRPSFWHRYWRIVKHLGLPVMYLLYREGLYRKEAIRTAQRHWNIAPDTIARIELPHLYKTQPPIYANYAPNVQNEKTLFWHMVLGI